MCAIFGILDSSKKSSKASLVRQIKQMSKAMVFRGPDNFDYYSNNNFVIGHNRLSIIDLRNVSNQPMISRSGRFIISFNGEIYNYNQLAVSFRNLKTLSDTEVLLEMIEKFGIENTLNKIEGMFAFALYDKKNNKFYLVRDRSGIKPLYWGFSNNIFFFSSDIAGIKKIKNINLEVDKNSVCNFFRHNYIPAPHSIYKNVKKLEHGSIVCFSRDKVLYVNKYYENLPKNSNFQKSKTFKQVSYEVKQLIEDSVKNCMISDLKVGSFLSGGIDSSIISIMMSQFSNKRLDTFYIGFNEKGFDEREYANEVASIIKSNHEEIYLDDATALDLIPKIHEIHAEPFADSSQIPTFILSKFAKRKNTVVCSGDGGDEIFGGYYRYEYVKNIHLVNKFFPSFVINMIYKLSQNKVFNRLANKYGIAKKIDTFLRGSDKDKSKLYLNAISHELTPSLLVNNSKEYDIEEGLLREVNNLDIESYMKYHDMNFYLPGDILTKLDNCSMYNSLEARVPFLEKKIIDYLHNQDHKVRKNFFKKKKLLINILKKIAPSLPDKFFYRAKLGLGSPIQRWLSTVLNDYIKDLTSKKVVEKYGILNYSMVENIMNDKDNMGRYNNYFMVWNILIFQQWCEHNL